MPALDISRSSFDERLAGQLDRDAGESRELAAACEQILRSGGKRLRPRVLEAASRAGPEPAEPAIAQAAVAVELFHCASLAHDDVIDDAACRRNQETVSARRGTVAAALAGGWLFGRSVALAADCGAAAALRFSVAAARVCEGQMLEVCDLFDPDRSEKRYFEAIGGKTAALFELSAVLGAELAAATPAAVETAAECGWSFGIAFQILDDVSDLVESTATTGKLAGKDLLQGVHTLPVIHAVEEVPALGDALALGVSPDALPRVLADIRGTDGITRALASATAHADQARSQASALPDGGRLEQLIDEVLVPPLTRLS